MQEGEYGTAVTFEDLPKPGSFSRWVPRRKRMFVLAVEEKLITREWFLATYDVDGSEFDLWAARLKEFGSKGLYATRYREYPLHAGAATRRPVLNVSVSVSTRERVQMCAARLAPREWTLLQFLAEHPKETLSRERILAHIYGSHPEVGDKIVEVFISKIRNKIGVKSISTVWGVGYELGPIFTAPSAEKAPPASVQSKVTA